MPGPDLAAVTIFTPSPCRIEGFVVCECARGKCKSRDAISQLIAKGSADIKSDRKDIARQFAEFINC